MTSNTSQTDILTKIFDWKFHVSMPQMWAFSKYDYEERGIPTSGNETLDHVNMTQYVNVMRSIAELAELHDEGKEFVIRFEKDIKLMFDTIVEYLDFTSSQLQHSLYYSVMYTENEAPPEFIKVMNDLVKLQNLGNCIFPVLANTEIQPETKGLIGWLHRHQGNGMFKQFDHDPLKYYNIDRNHFKENYNSDNRSYEIIDLSKIASTFKGGLGGYL